MSQFATRVKATASITAENTFAGNCAFQGQSWFVVSVEGTFSATVTLQKSYDGGSTWYDQSSGSWTAVTESVVFNADGGTLWRLGVKTGGFTSGAAVVRISQ